MPTDNLLFIPPDNSEDLNVLNSVKFTYSNAFCTIARYSLAFVPLSRA
jgi:hypothetical protein